MELEVAVKVFVKNISKLVYCRVFIRCGHRGFGLRSSTLCTSYVNRVSIWVRLGLGLVLGSVPSSDLVL